MKSLSATLLGLARATTQAPCLLAEVSGWGGATVRWAASDADVTWSGYLYAARPFEASPLELSADGGWQRCTLAVANHDLALTSLIDTADPKGAALTLRRVFLDNLTVSQPLAAGLVVQSWRLTGETAALECEGLSALLKRRVPARQFSRTCPWEFKAAECGYVGAETLCDRTDERCRELLNFANFGGFQFVLPRGGR